MRFSKSWMMKAGEWRSLKTLHVYEWQQAMPGDPELGAANLRV